YMAKKRVSLTLEEEAVERLDREAERENLNRSKMVGEILEEYFSERAINTAVILCGDEEMKSLRLYKGKPVLEHVLDHLAQQGISRAVMLAGRNDEIRDRFGENYEDIELEYVREEDPQGTAAALAEAEERLDRSFVLVNGHVISDVDLREMARAHNEESSVATMALTTVGEPSRYGVARMKGSKVLGFEEKPEPGEEPSRLINAGTYILEPDIFERLDRDSLEAVFEDLAEEAELSGYIYGGEWVDIDEY
ncbi:MAG: sugar phosphate nucleotidyltransferase, partial [Candidatus Nanohaloarchaea archaeon]|nr:sugar phosphate nucleotidyltransferase [Candidatus Nanohaloarchaea archaeon]